MPASGVCARMSRSSRAGRSSTKISCWAMTHAALRPGWPAVSPLRFRSASRSRRRRLCTRRHARPPSLRRYSACAFQTRQRAAPARQLSLQYRDCGRAGRYHFPQPFSRHRRGRGRRARPTACVGREFDRTCNGPTGRSLLPSGSSLGGELDTLLRGDSPTSASPPASGRHSNGRQRPGPALFRPSHPAAMDHPPPPKWTNLPPAPTWRGEGRVCERGRSSCGPLPGRGSAGR